MDLNHLAVWLVPGSVLAGFIASEVRHYFAEATKAETGWIVSDISKLQRPKDKAALRAVLVAIADRFPDGGAAMFSLAADAFIHQYPIAAPFREDIINGLQEIEKAAQTGVEEGLGPQNPSPQAP